ncbi:DUF6314 family protein [Rubricella aquisinus]|nr:DUF6314 family protein [Rubricella aquisinus]
MTRFAGRWRVHRDITDFASRWTGKFEGEAVFAPAQGEDTLLYREEGKLTFAGLRSATATRDYVWRFPAEDRVEVFFADGRPFHSFDPGQKDTEADHLCAADLYQVRYVFEADEAWRAEWRVEGPMKDYRMVTFYRRFATEEALSRPSVPYQR